MAFLAPLILVGLAALAVPVIIHMVYREQKDVVEFPSLMFIRKIPFRSYRRQLDPALAAAVASLCGPGVAGDGLRAAVLQGGGVGGRDFRGP